MNGNEKINVSKMRSHVLWNLIFNEWWRKYEYEVYYPLTSKYTQMEIDLWWDEDHWNIYNTYYKNTNIQLYSDKIKFLENSRFEARSKKDMFNLYTFLKDKLYEEDTGSLNKSKLITKPQLKSYILEGLSTLRQMCDNNEGYFRYVCHTGMDNCFELQLFCNGLHNHIDVNLSDDKTHWTVLYVGDIEIRIQIYQDKITFDEDVKLDDCFVWLNNRNQFRREMHDLYAYLNKRIFGAN
jgi:hypothetical protein